MLATSLIVLENVTQASDNDGTPIIKISFDSVEYDVGANVTFNLAMSPHVVIYKASDASGNSATCNISVTVEGKSDKDSNRSVEVIQIRYQSQF